MHITARVCIERAHLVSCSVSFECTAHIKLRQLSSSKRCAQLWHVRVACWSFLRLKMCCSVSLPDCKYFPVFCMRTQSHISELSILWFRPPHLIRTPSLSECSLITARTEFLGSWIPLPALVPSDLAVSEHLVSRYERALKSVENYGGWADAAEALASLVYSRFDLYG